MNLERPKSFAELVGYNPTAFNAQDVVHGTTVIALHYKGGVFTLADRRATMGNLIMVDNAQKVFSLDDTTVIAISGSFARSIEICRMLKHSFKYYRRMFQQEMSLDGKLHEIGRALAANLPFAMEGGVFLPIVAAYDTGKKEFVVYTFDGAGARFQTGDYAAAGSGSERIRGVFEYISRTTGEWRNRTRDAVLKDGLRLLGIAADLDSATGGLQRNLPLVFDLDAKGNREVTEKEIRTAVDALG